MKVIVYNGLGKPDSQGDIIMPDAIKKSTTLLSRNFDNKPLGKVDVLKEGNDLVADIDEEKFKGLYPAIGFQVLKSHEENDCRIIDEMKIHWIGLCDNPNIDEQIRPI